MNNPTKEDQTSGVLFGNYQVIAKLATGGMAELFLAKQRGLAGISKTVVIKCVLPHLASSDDFVQMFLDEARVATHLQHPNIVQIFEVGQVRNVYYIAMEYIRGLDLKRIRKQVYGLKEFQEAPPFNLFAGIISQAAAGLHYAHCATDEMGNPLGIIHRDVSPNNLLISFNGVVKIVDFGVAKAATQEHRTRAGMLKGRLSYMSPEQISGQPVKPSSDVFSLGIVLYELCTNRRLFKRANEAETVQAVLKHPITPPEKIFPSIHPELSRIIMKCMEREENKRYNNAEELRVDLENYMHSTEHYSPHKISEFLEKHFSEDKKQSSTGVLSNPFNQADLQYLAYRTGQFGAPPSTGSHPIPPPGILDRNNTSASFSDINNQSNSFGYFTRDESGVRGVVFDPPKQSRTIVWVLLLLLVGLSAGLAVAQWDQINRWLGNAPPPQPVAPRVDLAKRKKLMALHQNKINEFLVNRSFQKARTYLRELALSPDATHLGSWIADTKQTVELESSLASVELFYNQKNYDEAKMLIKNLMMKHSNSDQVREWYQKVQKAKATASAPPKREEDDKPETREAPTPRRSNRRKRRRRKKPTKRRKVAMVAPKETAEPKRPAPPAVTEEGTLFVNSTPNGRVELNGRLIGYTPINGKKIKVGEYKLTLRRPGYVTHNQQITISTSSPVDLNIRMESIAPRPAPIRVAPTPPPPRVEERPAPRTSDEPKAKMAFSKIQLPKRSRVRLLITDSRGLVANQYTDEHANLCQRIEEEVGRVLGSDFSVKGVTREWQKFVRKQATARTTQRMNFYPRAAAYVIYNNLLRGRSKSRVSQLLVLYQRKNRFRRYANK
ncbi:MAG: serine/threonine protein kinase [Myxococcales bacterium]|nr:serine/threonine protein kinase [Myxococcales bacterium]